MKKLMIATYITIASLSLSVCANQIAIDNEASVSKTAKQQLMTILAPLNNMSADFNQIILDVDGNRIQEGSGHFVLAKPDLVNWQTLTPDESSITSDGETLWLFDPFIEQVTAYSLEKSIANTPILLLTSSNEKLWQQYVIEQVDANAFNVIAKDTDAQVKQLTLNFNQGKLEAFALLDATGQQSQFKLSNIAVNQQVDNDEFSFNVPDGVLVDDQR